VRALEQHPGRWDLSRLFVFGSGGAIFTEQAQARLKAVVPHIVTNNGMGSSESGVLGGRENSDRSGAGYIVLDARPDLGLIDDAGRIVTAPGSEGILARTGYVPVGYYGDPVKSAATFVKIDGRTWAITGDRARVDADGNFVVLGRGSQCINTGGEKVYPEEVEEAALRYGAIKDVLVVGTPDERWGQRVTAVVALLPGRQFDQAEFERVCRERLAGYKVPRSVCIVEEVKRSPAGKADYGWAKRVATEKAGG
jgi:fatty-acyl-CoA synthase